MMGNIETIDVKLGNIKRNIDDLVDPDIYPNKQDKALLSLYLESGSQVGTTLAKIYGELSGKNIAFSESEQKLKVALGNIFEIKDWNTDLVKEIQQRSQPLSLVSGLVNKMNEQKVDDNIKELHKLLTPSSEVIKIFNRLDEDFKAHSGAKALFKDLEYLESLVVKMDSGLNSDEKELVKNYLEPIKIKMQELEVILNQTKAYFDKIKKSTSNSKQKILSERLAEIDKIINHSSEETIIVSHLTKDLNTIIENMRQCLGCLRKEANNDTNLAFAEFNKFFMISQQESQEGSIADEIVFFAPIKKADGKSEMSFVMDRIYGSKSADILVSHVLTIAKKFKSLKNQFPEAKLSISVTDSALFSAGINADILKQRLSEKIDDLKSFSYQKEIVVNIPSSGFSDNYIEFSSSDARSSGEKTFNGLIIS